MSIHVIHNRFHEPEKKAENVQACCCCFFFVFFFLGGGGGGGGGALWIISMLRSL